MKLEHAPITVKLDNGEYLHFWYANNRGRGSDNCTIIRTRAPRADLSANQAGVIESVRTSSWNGNVNFSKRIQAKLGL